MNKGILKGVILTLGILSLFGIVFAVGFHSANEIISGTFSGNYIFTGNLDFNNATIIGNGSSSIQNKWPDAIKCYDGNVYRILYTTYGTDSSTRAYRMINYNSENIISYNDDGSYLSNNGMASYDCVSSSMSIQELYNIGQAFNLVGGFDNHKISCPTGFTSVESKGRQWGCIQNDEAGTDTPYNAIDDCYNTYGGRLPFYVEIRAAFFNLDLIAEDDDEEWVSDLGGGTGLGVIQSTFELQSRDVSNSRAYRCFIPN